MELAISWIVKGCNLHPVNGLQVPKTYWRLFCSIFFPFGRHRTLVYDHSGVQARRLTLEIFPTSTYGHNPLGIHAPSTWLNALSNKGYIRECWIHQTMEAGFLNSRCPIHSRQPFTVRLPRGASGQLTMDPLWLTHIPNFRELEPWLGCKLIAWYCAYLTNCALFVVHTLCDFF